MDAEQARERFGQTVRTERATRGMSVEEAAKAGGIGHMTWRKIEKGRKVYDQTYAAVDKALAWTPGTALQAARTDGHVPTDTEAGTGSAASDANNVYNANTEPTTGTPQGLPQRYGRVNRSNPDEPTNRVLNLADTMTIAELRHIGTIYTHRADLITAELDAIQEKIDGIDTWSSSEPFSDDEFERSTELTNAYRRYLQSCVAIADMRTRLHEEREKSVGAVDVKALDREAEQLRGRLLNEVNQINEIRDRMHNAERGKDA